MNNQQEHDGGPRGTLYHHQCPGAFRSWGGCFAAIGCSLLMWAVIIWVVRRGIAWAAS
jgi:hypothetical protein